MKRGPALVFVLLTGCSTAPIADMMDFFTPGHLAPEKTAPYGGVCLPQGINAPPAATTAPAPLPVPPSAVPPSTGPGPVEWPPRFLATPTPAPGALPPPPAPPPS
jgi:hypothetical protein